MSVSPSLLVDGGNHRLKWRLNGVDHALEWAAGSKLSAAGWGVVSVSGEQALVASVRSRAENLEVATYLEERGYRVVFPQVTGEQDGLICGYRDSSQLGIDRWLAMLACWGKLQSSFIHVGAGTALTVDLVYDTGKHGGGYITAGFGLAREALLSRSEKLRQQHTESPAGLEPGKDTASAISNGALLAGVEFIRGVQRMAGMNRAPLVISGGDAKLLGCYIPEAVIWNNIVLDGLTVWSQRDTNES